MSEKQRVLSDTPVSKNNPDTLPIHPQVQTRYTQNITTIAKQWNDRFTTEATMQLGGKSYGKYEAGKLIPDLDADFWITRSNAIIEQQTTSLLNQGVSQQQVDTIMNIVNTDIRGRRDLTQFGKYIRIESLLLAQGAYIANKK